MSAYKVFLEAADETFAPPETIVEVTVLPAGSRGERCVYLSVSDYSETSDTSTAKRKFEVPALRLEDLIRAFVACDNTLSGYFAPELLRASGTDASRAQVVHDG